MAEVKEVFVARLELQKNRKSLKEIARGSYEQVIANYTKEGRALNPGEMVCMYRLEHGKEILLRTRAKGRSYSEARELMYGGIPA